VAYYQQFIFNWVAAQSALTGTVIAAAGVVFGLYGFRMLRFLVGLSCAGLGYVGGVLLAGLIQMPELTVVPVLALGGGVFGLLMPSPATILANAATWAVLGAYLTAQFGFPTTAGVVAGCLLGCAGGVLAVLNRRTMVVLMTSVQGAALFIIGFVGLASALMPSVGITFRQWSRHQSLVVPILLLMLVLTAYTCQVNARQGNLRTGGGQNGRRGPQRLPKRGAS